MQSKKLAGAKPKAATQHYLDIAEIRNDVVILKDGTLRAVIMVSSLNFALKSEMEQNAIVGSYVNFMNSFDHEIQIVIQSRKLNIEEYIDRLRLKEKEQTNDLLRMQISDYIQYVTELVELGDIMTKTFYLIIPYSPIADIKKGFWNRLFEVLKPSALIKLKEDKFQEYKRSLMQRVEHAKIGLTSIGLESVLLDTQSLIELYYNVYNPHISKSQKMQPVSKIQLEEQQF